MATKAILKSPGHTYFDRMASSEVPVIEQRFVHRVFVIGAVFGLLNILAITCIGLSAAGFIAGNNAIGIAALGPALAGIIGITGLQVRTIRRSLQGQVTQ